MAYCPPTYCFTMAHRPQTQNDSDEEYSDMLRCMVRMFYCEKERLPVPTKIADKSNEKTSSGAPIENALSSGGPKSNIVPSVQQMTKDNQIPQVAGNSERSQNLKAANSQKVTEAASPRVTTHAASETGKSLSDQYEFNKTETAPAGFKQLDASTKKVKTSNTNPVQGPPASEVTSSTRNKASIAVASSPKRPHKPEVNSSANNASETETGLMTIVLCDGEVLNILLPGSDFPECKKLNDDFEKSLKTALVKGVPVFYTVPENSKGEQEKDSGMNSETDNTPEKEACSCPPVSYAQLTFGVANAAREGRTKEVLRWLEEGGDINASDSNNRTLLHLAIEKQEVHLVKKLLRQPNIHLNQGRQNTVNMVKGNTPLDLAIYLCSEDCVKALLSSPSQCKVSLDGKSQGLKMAVRHAIHKKWWMILQMLIKAGLILQRSETTYLSIAAVGNKEMGILKLIIERDFPLDGSMKEIDRMLVELYDQGVWDYVGADKLFKAAIRANNYLCLRVLKTVMQDGNVQVSEKLLRMLFPGVTIHIGLANAVTEKDLEQVIQIINTTELSDSECIGTLFVAAVCNSTEAIIETLLNLDSYPKEVIDYVLIFAAVNDHFNFYHLLFKRYSFSYSVLLSAHRIASKQAITIIGSVLDNVEKQVVFDNGVISGKKETKQSQSSMDFYN